jgi:hypothetical protein
MRVQGREAVVAGPQQVGESEWNGRLVRPEGREEGGCGICCCLALFCVAMLIVMAVAETKR